MFDILGCIGSAAIGSAAIQGSQQQGAQNQLSQLGGLYNQQNAYNQANHQNAYNQQSWQQTFQPRLNTEVEDMLVILNNIFKRGVRWKSMEYVIAADEGFAYLYEQHFPEVLENEQWQKWRMVARLRGSAE
jgi:hypothetical protein